MKPKSKITPKSVIKYVLLLGLAAVLLYFAFRKINWSDFMDIMRSCNYWWILATMVLGFVGTILRGNRWRLMMLPMNKEITRWECYDAYAICYLANLGVPRSGEVVRCGILAGNGRTTFEGAIGSVVLERTWDLITLAVICVVMVFGTRFKDFLMEKMITPAAESLPFSAVWLVVIIVAVCVAIYFLMKANKEKIAKTRFGAKLIGFWRGLADGVKAGFKMEHKWAFFGYTIAIWIVYWLTSLFTLYAFPTFPEYDIMDALFLMVVGSLGWVVPTPGGFGAYHFIVSMTMVPIYGVSESIGTAFATISHESQIVQMIICGVISLFTLAIFRKKRLRHQPSREA